MCHLNLKLKKMTIAKRQAYRYKLQFNYSAVAISYEDFIKILPHFDLKNALIAEKGKWIIAKMTFEKKIVLTTVVKRFWNLIGNDKIKDSSLKISYTCDSDKKDDIFEKSKDIYYYPENYPEKITKSAGFIRTPVSDNPRYAWQNQLDEIMLESHNNKDRRHVIHVLGKLGNEGKSFFIKHKFKNSGIFGYFSPLFSPAQIVTDLIGAGVKSYYFADIPRAFVDAKHLYLISELLKDGILASSMYGNMKKNGILIFDTAVVVVFSNDLPPLTSLSEDRWKIYNIEYDSSGTSSLKLMSQKDCAEFRKN
jgi:hypothetical protein